MRTVRERMEQHRANAACNSCHRMIDPIGLALDNFDVTGAWRIRDNGMPVDAATLEEVGETFNLTRERIRQIEARAMSKLRHPSSDTGARDLLAV